VNALNNPFATDRVERALAFRPEWAGTTWKEIELRWKHLDHHVTLTGHHGSGKTTFLDAWKKRLIENGHEVISLFFNRESRSLSPADWQALKNCTEKTILLDGEEQLNWWARRKFYQLSQQADGVLVTRHGPGKLPTLLHFESDIKTLELCIHQLAPEHHQTLSPHLEVWWQQCNGNIREILLKCYDVLGRSDV
jgi:hypothetical protein